MHSARKPDNESERLAALQRYGILDTPPERAFDQMVELASELLEVPIALVSLVDRDRQWFKARIGLDATETHRDLAFCAHAILTPDAPFVVPDSHLDTRFADNPLVTGAPNVRFYAGIPIRSPEERLPLGTLCVIDDKPRQLNPKQLIGLQKLASQVEYLLRLKLHIARQDEQNAALEQAVLRADHANESKRRFLATLSHELRTPLNAIVGLSDLLLETSESKEQARQLAVVHSCAESLRFLVNDVLDLSKIEAGRQEFACVATNLRALANQALNVVRPLAEQTELQLNCSIDEQVPTSVLGDPGRLHQVVLNLLTNAVKFTPRGSVTLHVEYRDDSIIVVTVSDTGPGLSTEDQERIFEPFIQTDIGKGTNQGTGLGLTISRAMVRGMGGDLTVHSKLGEGSCFRLEVPAKACASESVRPPEPVLGEQVSSLRILVVDDNAVNRQVLRAILTRLGSGDIVDAEDGRAAVEMASSADLIFMDCLMPRLDGLQATRMIRESGTMVPIVALTGNAYEEDRRRCLDAGMNAVLVKPTSKRDVQSILARVLANAL